MMSAKFDGNELNLSEDDLQNLHKQFKNACIAEFKSKAAADYCSSYETTLNQVSY
jgi:hypothetical protein